MILFYSVKGGGGVSPIIAIKRSTPHIHMHKHTLSDSVRGGGGVTGDIPLPPLPEEEPSMHVLTGFSSK